MMNLTSSVILARMLLLAALTCSGTTAFSLQRTIAPSRPSFLASAGSQRSDTIQSRRSNLLAAKGKKASDEEAEEWKVYSSEVIQDDEGGDAAADWTPDRVKAQARKEDARVYVEQQQKVSNDKDKKKTTKTTAPEAKEPDTGRSSPYTDEEEEVISAMGGKNVPGNRKREPGFLGDSTLQEIATDYSVPICYVADVLCMWGVPVPINLQDRLGDLVTGEQAFALLEAVNSLDIAALNDRYSNQNIIQLCAEWGMDLQEVFEMGMKEGWSLPFGVQTCLRVEQEEELLRVLAPGMFAQDD
jgi:hypothetical protein